MPASVPEIPPRPHLVVHGHFYQPPRANPWSGAVERQPEAAPHHDWNARIAAECYRRLAFTRLLAPSGRIADVVNTYAATSFNVGPTLLEWLEGHEPAAYARILEADRLGRARFGRGGAMAQAYTHAILPLSAPRDRQTHLRWGIGEFRLRFGRDPEGLWLPETAADAATLADVAAERIRFVLLAPSQAARWRPLDGGPWRDVRDAPLDTGRPYRWLLYPQDPAGPGLDILFYHEGLSRGVAFEGLAGDARALAGRAAAVAPPGGIALVCTDGESYGHHHQAGHRTLAEVLFREAAAAGLAVTNAAAYLPAHPPAHQVDLWAVSAWSCAHGVGRWAEDCGCETGGRPGWNQRWRRPLRRALERLRDEGHRILKEQGGRLFRDPWAARDAYVQVLVARGGGGGARGGTARGREATEAFLRAQCARPLAARERVDALALLEMQRHLLLAETSCAWFFADLAGIETIQNLAEAARAIELGSRFTSKDLGAIFLDELRQAASNRPEEGDGRRIWERRVRPLRRSPELALAAAALRAMAGDGALPPSSHGHAVAPLTTARETLADEAALLGGARVEAPGTGEITTWGFVAHGAHPAEARCHLLPWAGEEAWGRVRAALAAAGEAPGGPAAVLAEFGGTVVTAQQLPQEDRTAVLGGLAAGDLARVRAALAAAGETALAAHERLLEAQAPVPAWLAAQANAAALELQARAAAAGDVTGLLAAVERAQRNQLQVDHAGAAGALDRALDAALRACAAAPGPVPAARARDLLAARARLGVPGEPERWDPHLAEILAALPPLLDRLEDGGGRQAYEAGAALLRVAEALGAEQPEAQARLRPLEERLAADPALWP